MSDFPLITARKVIYFSTEDILFYNRKRVWVHSQPLVHLAVPPPFPLIHEPVSEPPKVRQQKVKKPADKKADNKPDAKVENFPNER